MIDTRSRETVIDFPTIPLLNLAALLCYRKYTSRLLQMGITPILVSVDAFISETSVAQFGIMQGQIVTTSAPLAGRHMCHVQLRRNQEQHSNSLWMYFPLPWLVSCNHSLL